MTIASRSMWSALFALALAAAPLSAEAQTSHPAIRMLVSARGARARTQAARTVGRLRPSGARQALEEALRDGSANVRAAAAEALGALGDAAAIPSLRARRDDESRRVRGEVARALAQLEARTPMARGAAPGIVPAGVDVPMRRVDLARARYLVGVGGLTNGARVGPHHLGVLRAAVATEVMQQRSVALRPYPLPAEVEARAQSRRVRLFTLDGGVVSLSRTSVGGVISVRAEVSLVLIADPVHEIVGTLAGAATAREAWSGIGRDPSEELEVRAIQGAVHSALGTLEGSLRLVRN